MKQLALTVISTCTIAAWTPTQQHVVVPASRATTDAPAYGWIAGASRDIRLQTLIGASHLTGLLNQTISAIEFRRNSDTETYQGGLADLTVTLSISPLAPIDCTSNFANNAGAPSGPAFSGQVSIPTSPAPASGTATWTGSDIIRIPLTTTFDYTGGTLCVDIVGTTIALQNANWWMADLELDDVAGTVTDLGGGCGTFGGATSDWSKVSRRSLAPGANARFEAYGSPQGLALAAFGTRSNFSIPLSATGLPSSPGCDLWLATITSIMPTVFAPANPTDPSFGGDAEIQFKVPNSPSVFGFTMTTQWVDWTQMATSNAIEWTVANSAPTIDMAMIEGEATEPTGLPCPYMGHVMRFEY